jgi:hypothetical protein
MFAYEFNDSGRNKKPGSRRNPVFTVSPLCLVLFLCLLLLVTVHQDDCNKQNDREHNIQQDIIQGEGPGVFCAGIDAGWGLSHQGDHTAIDREYHPNQPFPIFFHDFQVFHIKQING